MNKKEAMVQRLNRYEPNPGMGCVVVFAWIGLLTASLVRIIL